MLKMNCGMLVDWRAHKKDSRTPEAPDPWTVARAQTFQNQQTAAYNAQLGRYDTSSPLGSQSWTMTGIDPATGAPQYRQDITLSPEQQALYDQQTRQSLDIGGIGDQLTQQARDMYGRALDPSTLPARQNNLNLSGLPELPGAGDLEGFRQQQTDALYGRNTQYLDDQFRRGEDAERTRLANMGVVEGSEAFNNAMADFNRTKEQAYSGARNDAIAGGGAEAERMFGIGSAGRNQMYSEQLGAGQFANDARDRSISEMFAFRNQPINELNALRGMSQAQMPQFDTGMGAPGGGAAPADIQGAIQNQYQSQVDSANARNASRNQRDSAITQAVGSYLMFLAMSDETTKDDHGVIGETPDEIPIHLFSYKDRPGEIQVGVMAQEAKKKRPDAVVKANDGLYRVNYAKLLAET